MCSGRVASIVTLLASLSLIFASLFPDCSSLFVYLISPPATVVELAETSYTISESDEVVEVCINAVGGNSSCPSTEPFHVSLSTTDQTAGVY